VLPSPLLRTFNFSPADFSEEELLMQKNIWKALIVFAVVIALAVPLARFAVSAEEHPIIHDAIDRVQGARDILVNDADRDFRGHRAKAVDHLNAALSELHQALESDHDRDHDHDH
jgi:hypothetical protein